MRPLLAGVAVLLVRAVIEGQWALLGIFGALVLLEVGYDRWFSKRIHNPPRKARR